MLKNLTQKQKNKIGLMGATILNNILYMFLNTFLVAYFFTLTNYNYKIISIYYIFSFFALNITFCLLAKVIKEKCRAPIFRMGIALHTIYILVIALLKDKIVDFYIPLGIFYGLVQGFFWSAGHILININAGDDSKNFISLKSILSKSLKVLFPFLFGASIELTSFSSVALVVVILSIIQFLFSLLIQDDKKSNTSKYNLLGYIRYLIKNRAYEMKDCYKIVALDAIINYLLETIVTILIVMTFKTNISLGTLTTVFSLLSILSLFIFQKMIKNNTNILKFGTIFVLLGMFFLLIAINKSTVILYNLFNSIFLVLFLNNAEAKRYSLASRDKKIAKEYIVEHQVISEFFLNGTRIIGYFILFLVSLTNHIVYFKVLLVLIAVCIFLYSTLLIKLNNK